MASVTISPKFQVVIPKEVRERLRLKPGQKVAVFEFENRIELVPLRPMKALRGFLAGMDTRLERDGDRL